MKNIEYTIKKAMNGYILRKEWNTEDGHYASEDFIFYDWEDVIADLAANKF